MYIYRYPRFEPRLGPILIAEVDLEGEHDETLLDTGSPVTIVSSEFSPTVTSQETSQGSNPRRVETNGGETT